jgi:hypothetical protein
MEAVVRTVNLAHIITLNSPIQQQQAENS